MSTPRETRATTRERRQHNLQLPQFGAGRAEAIRSRSPSPLNPGTFQFPPVPPATERRLADIEDDQFRDALSYPSTANMPDLSVEDIVKIATESAQAAARVMAAAVHPPPAAAAPITASQSVKKVELPPFDKKNIHTWIRRVEAAFGRAGVTTSQDKFFFIEAKLDVGINPKVNEYLCGESTDEKWDEFLNYLQEEYGKSKEQQASLFLGGIPRDGLRPTQHLAKIKELTKDITLDDLIKEMLLKDLPKSIRQALAERTNLSAEEAAKAADHHFDKDGRPKHDPDTPRINNVDEPTAPCETDDEADQVNAINRGRFRNNNRSGNRRPPPQRPFTQAFSNQQTNGYRNAASRTPAYSDAQGRNSQNNSTRTNKPSTLQTICRSHILYGEKAYSCEPGCQYRKPQSNKPTGNEPAGRRK